MNMKFVACGQVLNTGKLACNYLVMVNNLEFCVRVRISAALGLIPGFLKKDCRIHEEVSLGVASDTN